MKVFICDAGAFGTAMAVILARAGHKVTLLIQPYDQRHIDMFYNIKYGAQLCNYLHLPNVELPKPDVEVTDNFDGVKNVDVVFLGVPSQFVWNAFLKIKYWLLGNSKMTLVLLTKGLDDYGALPFGIKMRNRLKLEGHNNFAILSGPTPAQALVDPYRTFVASVASENISVIQKVRRLFWKVDKQTNLATVGTTDLVGVSWGGALKNAYAIKYGMLMGTGKNDLAWEYVNKLGLPEMKLFLDCAGARPKTLYSPAVEGDFRLTCQGYVNWESRNVAFGKFLAKRPTKEEIKNYLSKNTVEGYESALTLWKIARAQNLKTPFLDQIYFACTGASTT